jgi:5-methylcytosine-specific restriction endonuclease McrA
VRLKAKIRKPWFGLLGYTVVDLKRHLERQFSRNMTWANHGTYWHIDHVIPVSLFDFTTDDGVKACWALSNLRPLEAKANIKKNNKRTHLL